MASYRLELEHAYQNAHPTMKALLSMLDLERRQAVGDRDPIRHWHKGRIVLLGDAAHPTLQSLAQGACMRREFAKLRSWTSSLSKTINCTTPATLVNLGA